MDSEAPCCAHMRVIWTTDTDHHGLTHGWWKCSDCEAEFVPFARAVRAERDTERLDWLLANAYCDVWSKERQQDVIINDREAIDALRARPATP